MGILYFTDENLKWIGSLIDSEINKITDKSKITKWNSILEKIDSLREVNIEINITSEEVKEAKEILETLENLLHEYSEMKGVSDVDAYDHLKKEFAIQLMYLGSIKDKFVDELDYVEDVFKKEIRAKLVDEISELEGYSFTKADKLVEKDERYVNIRKKVHQLRKLSNNIKTKYLFYMQSWSMIFQSVSTASKERHTSNNNND
jgi:hypothetical protein